MAKRRKAGPIKRRNAVVIAMMKRTAKAGSHPDKRKRGNKRACRGRVVSADLLPKPKELHDHRRDR